MTDFVSTAPLGVQVRACLASIANGVYNMDPPVLLDAELDEWVANDAGTFLDGYDPVPEAQARALALWRNLA